jgi:dihydrofolate synthase/folylpolyglutamate synthase
MSIDSLLQPFHRFGVHLGLERIYNLLDKLGNPHTSIPIIHVAGSNGKGSVCAYLGSILSKAGYRVGRYTSPHLIDWTERICVDNQPISADKLIAILQDIIQVIDPSVESPTQFEVITAAAWCYFAQAQVDIAVIEVGLGGRLDATNVCSQPLVSVLTSISREHWQNLGPTLTDITREKAGIFKSNCPAVVGILPPEAEAVVVAKSRELNCPITWVKAAQKVGENQAHYAGITYKLPLLGEVQLINSALAIATCQILQNQGWKIDTEVMKSGIENTQWLGRIQWVKWQNQVILIDGAHNTASSQVLRQYVDTLNKPIIWVMGILETKDHREIFQALLRPQEQLYLVPVPDHKTATPEDLANLAQQICPQLELIKTFPDLSTALEAANKNNSAQERLIVLCGSLYLVGHFLAEFIHQ